MSNLSRRSLVSSAAVLPALAVPALASFSPDHPDAELLRLAVQLEAIAKEYKVADEASEKISDQWKAACDRAGLLPELRWDEAQAMGMSESDWWKERNDRHEKRAAIPHGDADLTDENGNTIMDRLTNRLWPIVDEIMAAQPKTLDGLRVQARALAVQVPGFWDNDFAPTEMDFIGAVFTFLGLDQDGKPSARLDGASGTKRHA